MAQAIDLVAGVEESGAVDLEREPVAQILPPGDDAGDHFLFGLARKQGVDQVDLVHRHELGEEVGLVGDAIVFELWLDRIQLAEPKLDLHAISRNPAVRRDIALLIDKSVSYRDIEAAVRTSAGDVLEKTWLFDVYEGQGIPEGKHSLGIGIQLRKFGANFTDEEANQVRERVVSALVELGGTTR